jgi:hypothetical protein
MARWMLAVVMVAALAGCWDMEERPAVDNGKLVPVTGWGKLVSVDQVLGMGVMEVEGEPVNFWWQNRLQLAAHGEGALGAPEMKQVQVPFNAKVGDSIYFKGFKTRGEIYVTAARVGKK